jgi:folate-binding protein YgfZ
MNDFPEMDLMLSLDAYGLVRVGGTDARSFLHGQLSNSIEDLAPGHSRLAAWCNAKGRVIGLFRVFRQGEDYFLRAPRSLLPLVLPRLRRFVLRSRVELEDISMGWGRLALSGPGVPSLLVRLAGGFPDQPGGVLHAGGLCLVRAAGLLPRVEIHGEAAAVEALTRSLANAMQTAAADAWQLQEILAGQPEVWPETCESFVPQMLNLHWLQGIDFRKGCYPGQEIVARMQYLGQLKRRMYLASAETSVTPNPGSDILATGTGEAVGTVASAAAARDGRMQLLAVLQNERLENGLQLAGTGAVLSLEPLPYPVTETAGAA